MRLGFKEWLAAPPTLTAIAGVVVLLELSAQLGIAATGWPTDPSVNVAVRDTLGAQTEHVIVSDAGGGAFFVWKELGVFADRRVARLDASGSISAGWPASGINLTQETNGAFEASVVRSGPSSVIVVWEERLNADFLRAQKIDTSGVLLWPAPGIAVSDDIGQLEAAVGLPDGGVMVVFSHDYGSNVDTAFVMRINADGTRAWPQAIVLCDAIGRQANFRTTLVSDSEMVAEWMDGRTTPIPSDPQAREVYAQKLRFDGVEVWAHNGKRLLAEGYTETIRANGFGGFAGPILFNTLTSSGDLKLLNIGADGSPMPGWPDEGRVIAANPTAAEGGGISVSPTDGSTLLVWGDGSSMRGLKAQKIDVQGNVLWPNGGVALFDSTVTMAGWNLAPDGKGGAFVTIEYPLSNTNIIAQHVLANGVSAWPGWGVPVTVAPNVQYWSQVEPDSAGGVFVCWRDWRHSTLASDPDLYAQHVNADGTLGGVVTATEAAAVEASYEGGCARIAWYASDAFGVEFTVQREAGDGAWAVVGSATVDGTGQLAHRDCDVQPGATYSYRLEWNDAGTLRHTVPISLAIDPAPLLALGLPYPNPIGREATVEFTLPRDGHVRLEVLDLAGRRVATILAGTEAAGVHRSSWRPAAGDGRRLAPGCYVLRLSSEGQALSRRVVILR